MPTASAINVDQQGKIKLANVRLSFPQLFTPKSTNGGAARFGANFLMPSDSPAVKVINEAMEQVAKAKWPKDWRTILDRLIKVEDIAFKPGDAKSFEGYKGMHFLTANSNAQSRPNVWNTDKSPLVETDGVVYAGCYVHAMVVLWAQDDANGKRINAQLKAVMFAAAGDAFSGSGPVDPSEFDDLTVGAAAANPADVLG